ncbi:hypothetical protein SBRCBS47491_000783 [Sporothrix bragantina]|uniref:Uncharacterized protein n=1 Tax=Sporothrix bragantina TaxID=671064 RepID=A0ABP0AT58_9PEZI
MDPGQSYQENDPNFVSQGHVQLQQQQHPQQQQGFIRWAAQPITAYQLVPMDYQPIYAQQPSLQQVQPQQHQTVYGFSQMAAVPQMMPMTPMSPITSMSPTGGQFMTSPIRRRVSLSFQQISPQRSFFDPSPPQNQYQGAIGQQRQQYHVQQSLHHSVSTPLIVTHGLSGSPEVPRASQSFKPNMGFATPLPASKRSDENIDVFSETPTATGPATLPRLAKRHTSTVMHRRHKPQPLPLSTPQTKRAFHMQGHNGSPTAPKSSARFPSQPIGRVAVPPSITPVGSDREYDGGDSSYSTSPLGSETNAKMKRRLRTIPFVPRIPTYLLASSGKRVVDPPPSPTPKHSNMSFRERLAANNPQLQSENSLEKFLQDHIHTIESHYAEDKATDESTKARAGSALLGLSSSDEWNTTTDTDPIRSRHRHRVSGTRVDQDETAVVGGGFCNYGMQQCSHCGLFISRPETHICMR